MKVKRFNNLWAMGLILFGAILVAFYVAKIFFPEFIVGVAEIPSIVDFGNYVDSNLWAYYLFNFVTSMITMFFFCCACCRIKSLKLIEWVILGCLTILSYSISVYLPALSFAYNNVLYILVPLIIAILRKDNRSNIFYSTAICFVITSIAQAMSLTIRDISTLIAYPNTAVYFVLLIDLYIWNILLYLFYNYEKGEKENG